MGFEPNCATPADTAAQPDCRLERRPPGISSPKQWSTHPRLRRYSRRPSRRVLLYDPAGDEACGQVEERKERDHYQTCGVESCQVAQAALLTDDRRWHAARTALPGS
jgi:hypothetical protein